MYSYPWLAEFIYYFLFFSAGWGLPGLAGPWGLESSLGVEIQPWDARASPLPDFHVYLLRNKPTGKEVPHTLGASAAINPKRVE